MNPLTRNQGLPGMTWMAASAVMAVLTSVSMAATSVPSWYGQPNTTRNSFRFTTNSTTPAAETLENAYGTPTVGIAITPVLASGWQASGSFSGVTQDGAWDIAKGTITIDIPVALAPPPGSYYQVEFFVYTVSLVAPSGLPTLSYFQTNPGDLTALGQTTGDAFVAAGPAVSTWNSRSWGGTFDNITDPSISFVLTGSQSTGSVVDSYEVFTKFTLVPEPSAAVVAVGLAGMLALRRRRNG